MGGDIDDVSLLTNEDGIFELKITAGHTHSVGEHFDKRIMDFCIQDLAGIHRATRRLKRQCEREKRALSSTTQATSEMTRFPMGLIAAALCRGPVSRS